MFRQIVQQRFNLLIGDDRAVFFAHLFHRSRPERTGRWRLHDHVFHRMANQALSVGEFGALPGFEDSGFRGQFDFYGNGESGGTATTSGPEIRSDVLAVMDYYDKNLGDYGPLLLAGYSHGGRAAVFAAEQKPGSVKAIILESIPYSLSEGFKRIYKVTPPPFPEGDIENAFRTVSKVPILLMMGDKDNAIVPEEAEKIKSLWQNPASRLVIFTGAVHNLTQAQFKSLYIQSIQTFLTEVMK